MATKPVSRLELITPAKAKAFLENNKQNRPLNKKNLDFLKTELTRGNFHTTGDSIKIAENGDLLDGQHRLQAIVETGIAIEMFVVRGLEKKVFKYMDQGKGRTAGDILAIEKVENPTQLSSMSRFIMLFQAGKFGASAGKDGAKRTKITNADISAFVSRNKTALQESRLMGYNKDNKLVPAGTLSSLHFIFSKLHTTQANDFCEKIVQGNDLSKTDIIYMLRTILLADLSSRRKMGPQEKIALICKAWNIYRAKKTVLQLKWDVKEDFPKPI